MENIHLRFKEVRQNNGLTQAEMADKLGMKQPAWARLENGGVPDPRISTIIDICKTFNVDANWLLGVNEKEDSWVTAYKEALNTVEKAEMNRMIREMLQSESKKKNLKIG